MKKLIFLTLCLTPLPVFGQLATNDTLGRAAFEHSLATRRALDDLETRVEQRLDRLEENQQKTTLALDAILKRLEPAAEPPAEPEPLKILTPPSVAIEEKPELPPEACPTPLAPLHRMLADLNLQPENRLLDPGCGADARVLIAAAEIYGCRGLGFEIDHDRAEAAKRAVAEAGLSDRITIKEGDARGLDFEDTDVGFVYLYQDLLAELRPKLETLDRFASYMHFVPGIQSMTKRDDYYIWKNPHPARQVPTQTVSAAAPAATAERPYGVWKGIKYYGRQCSNPNCDMCNKIQAGINQMRTQQSGQQRANGHWENRKQCYIDSNGRRHCQVVPVWIPD